MTQNLQGVYQKYPPTPYSRCLLINNKRASIKVYIDVYIDYKISRVSPWNLIEKYFKFYHVKYCNIDIDSYQINHAYYEYHIYFYLTQLIFEFSNIILKLVTLNKNGYDIRNQHGRFRRNRCTYCQIYHDEITNYFIYIFQREILDIWLAIYASIYTTILVHFIPGS